MAQQWGTDRPTTGGSFWYLTHQIIKSSSSPSSPSASSSSSSWRVIRFSDIFRTIPQNGTSSQHQLVSETVLLSSWVYNGCPKSTSFSFLFQEGKLIICWHFCCLHSQFVVGLAVFYTSYFPISWIVFHPTSHHDLRWSQL